MHMTAVNGSAQASCFVLNRGDQGLAVRVANCIPAVADAGKGERIALYWAPMKAFEGVFDDYAAAHFERSFVCLWLHSIGDALWLPWRLY
jgi:hypothetical protein